jgi:hypothetical protein
MATVNIEIADTLNILLVKGYLQQLVIYLPLQELKAFPHYVQLFSSIDPG